MTRLRRLPIIALMAVVGLAAISPTSTISQNEENLTAAGCGSNVTPEEAERYREIIAKQLPDVVPYTGGPLCVPIAGHIIRTSAGTGGLPLSQYTQSIVDANTYFNPMGISFFSLGFDYIDDDDYYTGVTGSELTTLRLENVVPGAINVYYAPSLPGLCGISSFTFSSVQGIIMANGCTGIPSNPSTMPHEIGHYFDLFHTHETAFGVEFVNGTNCNSAGDLFCDTPADPTLSGASVNAACVYVGGGADPNGDPWAPDTHQIMSYSRALCADIFSPQSHTKAVNTLVNLRPELLAIGCSPPGAPTITSAGPGDGFLDQTLDVTIVGSNLGAWQLAVFGPGVTTNSTTVPTPDTLLANITIDAGATVGFRDVYVTDGFSADTLTAAFEIMATPSHYVAANGGNVYPYASPAHAAISFANVMLAAGDGDSVKVDSSTVSNVSGVNIAIPLSISGGWTDDFTARDVATKKTTLSLAGNMLISSATGTVTLDGFVLEGGTGSFDITPISGNYGGALRIVNTTATVSNCEIHSCSGAGGPGFGGGGAVFATGSTVNISNSHIHDNDATYGGGLYFYNSTGSLTNNVIENNTVAFGGTTQPAGGGVRVENTTSFLMTDNTVSNNLGAQNGGGMFFIGSTGASVTGGAISGNTATFGGAGTYVNGSTVVFNDAIYQANSGAIFGGGISSENVSTLTVSECEFLSNAALLGAGIYASTGTANVRHNLLVGNAASNSGGGVSVSNLTGGEILGNTLDQNTATSGGGGMSLVGSAINVFNNIIANSTGDGINCGGALPTLSYNLVFNSSGADYVGCAAGTGALSTDPLFVNAVSNDYHLAVNSPAIDAGEPMGANNDPDGSRGDMGRYGSHAFTMDQPVYPKNVMAEASGSDVVVSWDPNPEGDIDYYAIYCDSVDGFTPGAGNLFTTSPDTTENLGSATDTLYYVVCAVDTNGYASGYSAQITADPPVASAVPGVAVLTNRLHQNVPNPFNPTTTIAFSIAQPERVTLTVYDVSGKRVRTLINDARSANSYKVTWDGRNDAGQQVSSGIYFYRLETGRFAQTKKMVLLK